MAQKDARAGCWTADTSPPPIEAFHIERIVDPFTLKETIGMVRHPGHSFGALPPRRRADDAQWQAIGVAYLSALSAALRVAPGDPQWLHQGVWEALQKPKRAGVCRFGWLGVTWQGPVRGHRLPSGKSPLGSFRVDRDEIDGSRAFPRLLVLLAGNVVPEHRLQVGSDVGLRMVLHEHRDHVRIHGVTLAGLSGDRALRAIPTLRPRDKDMYDLVRSAKPEIGDALKCKGNVWIANLETTREPGAPSNRLSASGCALRSGQRTSAAGPAQKADAGASSADRPVRARAYDFRVDLDVDPRSGAVQVVQIHRDEYVGSGARTHWTAVRAFAADPASQGSASTLRQRRPALPDEELDGFRTEVDLGLLADSALRFSDPSEIFETRSARAGDVNLLGGRTVPLNSKGVVALRTPGRSPTTKPAMRSDLQASIETHVRAADLILRFQGYGIDPDAYFRFARLPLVQRARPAMQWAPDGELPNAEVRPFLGDPDTDKQAPRPSDRLQLLVKYGSADPLHRHKLPMLGIAGGVRRKAQYLSVACDPRWCWHEFGHVLSFASTGELEFPFAHSAGDALAAIATDPLSELAGEGAQAPIRFVTFPWIEVPGRCHGRSAARGYGWCGRRNLVRLDFTATLERYHHSYFGEQLMSSSLFRLYRSLGGDTRGGTRTRKGDEAMRLEASDYCIYLIIRGLSLLGPDTVAPARTPDQLVSALIDADLGTGSWRVQATWPFDHLDKREIMQRQGGRVHKVIRWAFERQGLYATDDPRATSEGPGLPPPVDVYIADRRPLNEHEAGGYAPVPLRISGDEHWHAHVDWLMRSGRQITVKVANRGAQPAQDVTLRAWWGASTTVDGPVLWHHLQIDGVQTIVGDQPTTFTIALAPNVPSRALWFLVSADAPADPSNLALGMPPPSSARELMELVAHDNNLALARL
jgi:hypothetical protein